QGELGERAAEDDRDVVGAVARELRLEVLGDQRGAPAELDDVDRGARDLHQPVDLGAGQALVEDVGEPALARLVAALGEVEEPGHFAPGRRGGYGVVVPVVGAAGVWFWSAPTVTTTVA